MPTPRRPRTFAVRLDSRTESTPLARYLLRAYLAALPTGERYADIAELLLSELFANAVQHCDAPIDRLIEIRFALINHRLRLEVHDAGAGRPTLRSASPSSPAAPANPSPPPAPSASPSPSPLPRRPAASTTATTPSSPTPAPAPKPTPANSSKPSASATPPRPPPPTPDPRIKPALTHCRTQATAHP
ncbi:ATP-binding protein [Kitasatospora sp. NPDC094011]|uniref:ATP-binding protein n=1 Tax=Kitasatospora sp. NPDC094011 TaxID=3364090 RepID=UPI00380EEBA7